MPRTDNDTWDLASSVGATATMVAAARAMATNSPDAVINDPFAEPLVRAVGVDFFTKLATGELTAADLDSGSAPVSVQRFADGMAARTRFFDDFFRAATDAGIRQAVILAAGLDARAYRLQWPAGTTVFEIDQPEVIAFKTQALADLGATPTAEHKTVAIDLRDDWPTALREAGLDTSAPIAWIAEGLLGYLPPEAQDRLLDQIAELSPAGSRLAVEGVPVISAADQEAARERMQSVTSRWQDHGFDLDFSELTFLGERAEAAGYLREHGWQVEARKAEELIRAAGLTPVEDDEVGFGDVVYITAQR
ncbi:class I SAM-dependent methyltransferase [Mycolicibacterium tokaiense]|uniref:S-adenosyl-L-methionine-dependent methyltransferase n=1 Tax=Mycolicibacterium tokaiense TaxID=39695 RepID=A0A378TB36_9MYCO|nr:class I SAM-dependent methyltransferase [Mycolicibacterium tokaiense]BBY87470.1 putative S-adenosyl-L-methionine-dependent methyltransferase [Mycolicibacterium tokaiense]STZ58011.1 putative methyltransferase [Mycolicibacterium tokaiense]